MVKKRNYRNKADERFGNEDDKKREKERVEREKEQENERERKQLEPAWAVARDGGRWFWVYWKVLSSQHSDTGWAFSQRSAEEQIEKRHGTLPSNRLDDRAAHRVLAEERKDA